MFHMNVLVGTSGATFHFLFREKERAMNSARSIETDMSDFATIVDDFGSYLSVRKSEINAVEIIDLKENGDAAIERAINQQKVQIKGNRRAAEDPVLKLNAMAPLGHPGGLPGMVQGNSRRPS